MYNLWYFVAFYAVLLQKVLFFAIYAVFRKIGLLQFTRYCVEKILAEISDRGEKMTNMRYDCWYQGKNGLLASGARTGFKNQPKLHRPKPLHCNVQLVPAVYCSKACTAANIHWKTLQHCRKYTLEKTCTAANIHSKSLQRCNILCNIV